MLSVTDHKAGVRKEKQDKLVTSREQDKRVIGHLLNGGSLGISLTKKAEFLVTSREQDKLNKEG